MSTDLIPLDGLESPNIPRLFVDGGLDLIIAQIEKEVSALVPDVSTPAGRKEITSAAAYVSRSKTYLDTLGKDYVAGLKQQTKAVDVVRKDMRDRLGELRDRIKKPVEDWNQKEIMRVEGHRERIDRISSLGEQIAEARGNGATVIQELLDMLEAIDVDKDWEEFQDEGQQAKDAALYRGHRLLLDVQRQELKDAQEEADRRKQDEQARKLREERIAREAAENARRKAEEQARRAAAELAEREAAERLKAAEAAEKARLEAESFAKREMKRKVNEAEEQARRKAVQAIRQAELARKEEEDARRMEQIQREADKANREKIKSEITEALLAHVPFTESQAQVVVAAITKGSIPHISIMW